MLECVPNVSEGRDATVLDALAAAGAGALLDVHADPDHHRAVFTLADPDDTVVDESVRALARVAVDRVDVRVHDGVHPRTGALDVVPFVALAPTEAAVALEHARDFGAWAARALGVSVHWYGAAHPDGRSLPDTRRHVQAGGSPDLAAADATGRTGMVLVGARPVLVAVNVELDRDDVTLARRIASRARERDGGLPGVRALGLRLASRGRAQVSMNLVALSDTGLERACEEVVALAGSEGAGVARIELVGLLPAAELARCSAGFRARYGIGPESTIEARLARRARGDAAKAWPEAGTP